MNETCAKRKTDQIQVLLTQEEGVLIIFHQYALSNFLIHWTIPLFLLNFLPFLPSDFVLGDFFFSPSLL